MIYLTGDVHQEYRTPEQARYPETEVETTLEYVEIARSYDLDLTLFVTGRAVEQDRSAISGLADDPAIEIGGHTWSAFRPRWLHYQLFDRFFETPYGPRVYQRRDIHKTLRLIESCTGTSVTAWRTHGYNSDHRTYEILAETTIEAVSDEKDPDRTGPYDVLDGKLREFPINVLPDHEHLIHGIRTTEQVAHLKESGWSDAFGPDSYPVEDWGERVIEAVERHQAAGRDSTLLIHPGCMRVADEFDTFERICAALADSAANSTVSEHL